MQRLMGWFVSESALVWFLHQAASLFPVYRSDLHVWIRFTPPDLVVMAGGRYLALALAYWLLISSTIYSIGLLSDLPALVRSVEWATLPVVRTAARRAVALTMATVTLAPAAVIGSPSIRFSHGTSVGPDVPVDEADPKTTGQGAEGAVISVTDHGLILPPGAIVTVPAPARPSVSTPRLVNGTPTSVRAPDRPATGVEPNPSAPPTEATEYRVIDGESLWSIATRHLAASHRDVQLSDWEKARYWTEVVDANRSSLTSGNPDLIFPGEVIVLPPVLG